jgi:regulator of RNase E activity RraA
VVIPEGQLDEVIAGAREMNQEDASSMDEIRAERLPRDHPERRT